MQISVNVEKVESYKAMAQQFRNVVYVTEKSGTAKWRRIWPIQSIDCISQQLNCQVDYTQTPVLDQNYYKGMTSVTVQRWISEQQEQLMLKFLKPLCDANGGWLIYEEDDAMFDKDIPLYNRGRAAFEGPEVQGRIKNMLNAADFVTVTTDYLRDYYHKNYDVPLDHIIALPNLLPRYLFDDRFDIDRKLAQFGKLKAKPRIGIVSSLSHYNVDNVHVDKDGKACRKRKQPDGTEKWMNELNQEVNEADLQRITDDIDDIVDCIRSTVNDFQWVFFGFCPPKLEDLAKEQKIEVYGGSPIMNYASRLENLKLQAIVAPIKDMEFNRCKSFIKYMEAAALGIPLFASGYMPYTRVMPQEQLFIGNDDLKQKLMKLKFTSGKIYTDILMRQWAWLNSPAHEGDFDLKNFWLEDNLHIYFDLYRLRQKTITIGMQNFSQQYEARKQKEAENTIFKNDNGVQIIK